MNRNRDQLSNIFPNNTSYIVGECYLVWGKADSITSQFAVECTEIDDSLILKAKPNHNQLELIDGSIITGLSFTVSPIDNKGNLKSYAISSSAGKNGSVNIQIIDREQTEQKIENETYICR